jgi:hypothetical protein
MDKKSVLPVMAIALLACVALMLSVIGGLYAYNTFLADAPAVHAQSSDKGPSWTVTAVPNQSGTTMMAVVAEVKNPLDENLGLTKQLAVYEIQGNNGKCDLYFVGARTLEWDFQLWDQSGETMTGKKWGPIGIRNSLEEAKKKKK